MIYRVGGGGGGRNVGSEEVGAQVFDKDGRKVNALTKLRFV